MLHNHTLRHITPLQAAKQLKAAMVANQVCPCCGAPAASLNYCGCDAGEQHHECDNPPHANAYGCGLWQNLLERCCVSNAVFEELRGANQ